MRLANITWPRAQKYFEENDMVIVSIGSIECHGRHMPLGTDTLIPDRLLELIEEKSDVLIAPTIPYGACECLEPYPGTINLGTELLYNLLYKVVENLYNHGARKILVLNGHGGNIKTIERVGLDFEKKGALVVMLNWWLMAWDMKPEWKGEMCIRDRYGTDIRDAVKFPDQMQAIVDIVERELGILLDESSLHYERFMTHIKFLICLLYTSKYGVSKFHS